MHQLAGLLMLFHCTDVWAESQCGEIHSIQQAVGGLLVAATEFSQRQEETSKVRVCVRTCVHVYACVRACINE